MFTLWVNDEQHLPESRHMATARRNAVALAERTGSPVEVCTHDANGARRVRTIIHPDGRAAPPTSAETDPREGCVRHEGRTCFCTPCRAERRASARG